MLTYAYCLRYALVRLLLSDPRLGVRNSVIQYYLRQIKRGRETLLGKPRFL